MFAQNLKYLRHKYGMGQQELAELLGKSISTISEWESGKYTPKAGVLSDISKMFNVSLENLMAQDLSSNTPDILPMYNQLTVSRKENVYGYAKDQLHEQQAESRAKKDTPDNVVSINRANKKIADKPVKMPKAPVDIDGCAAAGYGEDNDNRYGVIDTVQVPEDALPTHYDLAFKVSGNSMNPMYDDGEIVFVQKTDDNTNGMIAVVDIDGLTYIKKLIIEDNRLCLRSLNDDIDQDTGERIYPDFYADESDRISVIGRVVGSAVVE